MAKEELEIIIDGDATGAKSAAKQANSAMGGLGSTIKKMALAGGALFIAKKAFDTLGDAIRKTAGFIKGTIDTGAQFQRYQTVLKTVLGSTEKAVKKMKWIKDFAKSTPFELPGLVEATVRLQAYGIDAEDVLETLGDTAAAMGKDVMMSVEALADAQTGEFERLKEFGIKAIQEAGQTYLLYTDKHGKEQKALIDRNNREIITSTLTGIWNEKYAGGMKELTNTWEGAMSNLKDTWTQWRADTGLKMINWFMQGKEVIDPLTGSVSNLASPFEKLQKWIGEATTNMSEWLDLNWDNIIGIAEDAFKTIEEFIRIIKEADYSAVKQGIDDLAAAFGLVIGNEGDGVNGAKKSYQEFVNTVGGGLTTLAEAGLLLRAIVMTLAPLIELLKTTIVLLSSAEIKNPFDSTKKNMEDLEGTIANTESWWDRLKNSLLGDVANMDKAWADYNNTVESNAKRSTSNAQDSYNSMESSVSGNMDAIATSAATAQGAINAMHGVNIESTHTITTHYKTIGSGGYKGQQLANMGRQRGGVVSSDTFAGDLGVPLIKGEAVLPAPVVRAIKENRGSFAGVNMNTNNNQRSNLVVNITGNTFVSMEDVLDEIEAEIPKRLNLQGANIG